MVNILPINKKLDGSQWVMPVILATQKAEIRRIKAQGQPRQNESKTLSQKYPTQKRAGQVAQAVASMRSCIQTLVLK
jgi:hypothetical protein